MVAPAAGYTPTTRRVQGTRASVIGTLVDTVSLGVGRFRDENGAAFPSEGNMLLSSRRLAMILGLFAGGCGQIAADPSASGTGRDPAATPSATEPGASSGPPAASVPPTSSSDNTPAEETSIGPTRPRLAPAICSGAPIEPAAWHSAGALALGVQGLWIACDGSPTALCPAGDSVILIGDPNFTGNAGSRAASCGNLTSHGSGFTADPAAVFTYEIVDAGGGAFSFHAWNAAVDRSFDVVYFGDTMPTSFDAALSLTTATTSGALRRTEFTTY